MLSTVDLVLAPAAAHGIDLGDQFEGLGLVVLAAVLGAALGIERSLSSKPAGLRTHMLVAGTAAGVTWMGDLLTEVYGRGDPSRAMHAIITGIGFLGAGTIITNRQEGVVGLTTAAGLLFAAAVGIMVGLGLPVLAVGSTVLAVLIVHGLERIDHVLARRGEPPEGAGDASAGGGDDPGGTGVADGS